MARVAQEVVAGAQVLCCTLTGALHPHLSKATFDVTVVDEAAQALEAATWSALLKAPRCVLAGGAARPFLVRGEPGSPALSQRTWPA